MVPRQTDCAVVTVGVSVQSEVVYVEISMVSVGSGTTRRMSH